MRTGLKAWLQNALGETINPATEDKQDDAITAIEALDPIGLKDTVGTPINPATEEKQDDAITELDAIETNQTDGSQKIQIVDAAGNVIESHISSDGDYHLGTSMEQNVVADPNNTSTVNLASGATFTGTSTTTLGVVGLQWSLNTTENCTVYVEQSPDNTNWDLSYSFDYIASKGGQGETVQATQAYWRIRVTNVGMNTTSSFRLQGVLCPIATPLPSSLSQDARLKTESTLSGRENTDRHVWVSPTNTLTTNTSVRLVGTNFDGIVKDTNFWNETGTANGGVVAQTGEIKLTTSTAADGIARYMSVRRARFVVGSALIFIGAYKFNDALVNDNVRRCGAYDDDEGFYFQLDGSTFSVGSRKNTGSPVDTLVNSGDFNGNMGADFTPDPTLYYKLDIEWTPLGAFYYVNGALLHKSVSGHLTRKLSLPITFENINEGSTTDVTFDCLGVTISRLGELETEKTSISQEGTVAALVLKQGAGELHGMILSDVDASSVIILYDNVAASGKQIFNSGSMEKKVNPFHIDFFKLPFSTGLTLAITTQDSNATVVYE